MVYEMLQWSTDNNGKVIVLINGQSLTNVEAIKLRDELVSILERDEKVAVVNGVVVSA